MIKKQLRVALAAVLAVALCGASTRAGQSDGLIANVRAAIARGDIQAGEKLVAADRAARGVTPEGLAALSWVARGALAAGQLQKAETLARQTHELALAALKGRTLDREPHLQAALGAAIEVQAQAAAAQGARAEAVSFLRREVATYAKTSIGTRIQKNLNLLSLEGTTAPALDISEYIGPKPQPLASLKGRVVLMFFWAHWCSDCKLQGPILARLLAKYGAQGLTIVAPTQRFGYVAGGRPAPRDEEKGYIGQVWSASYGPIAGSAVPLGEANYQQFGVSTTPTLVLVDRAGVVRLYHPGRMTEAALEPIVRRLVGGS